MSLHNCSVFKNSCIKPPINPVNRLPLTCYERRKKCGTSKSGLSKSMNNLSKDDQDEVDDGAKMKIDKSMNAENKDNFMSLIEFYESIPGLFIT